MYSNKYCIPVFFLIKTISFRLHCPHIKHNKQAKLPIKNLILRQLNLMPSWHVLSIRNEKLIKSRLWNIKIICSVKIGPNQNHYHSSVIFISKETAKSVEVEYLINQNPKPYRNKLPVSSFRILIRVLLQVL